MDQIEQSMSPTKITDQQQNGHSIAMTQTGKEAVPNVVITPTPTPRKGVIKIDQLPSVFFTGRQKELDFLHEHLKPVASMAQQRRVVVWGCGGAGKSQLITQYVCTHTRDFSDIFWVTAWNERSLRLQYADIARQIDLPEKLGRSVIGSSDLDAQEMAIEAVKEWFSKHETGNWLLIIDNADDLKELKLQKFLPPTMNGNVIITSRNKHAEEFGYTLELKGMSADDAQSLLLRRSAIMSPTLQQQQTAARITKSLGNLALAVEQAGAYIRTVGGTVEEYEDIFQADRFSLLSDSYGVGAYGNSVLETFELSVAVIEKRNAPAVMFLGALGYLDGARIQESLVLNGLKGFTMIDYLFKDPTAYKVARGELQSFSLISLDTVHGERIISIHPLIHYFSRVRLNSEKQLPLKCFVGQVLMQGNSALHQEQALIIHIMHFCNQAIIAVDENGKKGVKQILWASIVQLLCQHYHHWRNEGNMEELEQYCRVAMKDLDQADSDDARTLMLAALELRRLAIDYVETTDTAETITRSFLLQHMKPLAISALQRAQSDDSTSTSSEVETSTEPENSKSHQCASLDDVFMTRTPVSILHTVKGFFHNLAVASIGRKHWHQANLLSSYAELPLTRIEVSTPTSIAFTTLFVNAARLAEKGDSVAVCDVYQTIISNANDGSLNFSNITPLAVYDYSKFLNQLGKAAEAELVTRNNFASVLDPATKAAQPSHEEYLQEQALVWANKSLAASLIQQGFLEEARRLLLELHQTCKKVLGARSLNTWHTVVLLQFLHDDPAFPELWQSQATPTSSSTSSPNFMAAAGPACFRVRASTWARSCLRRELWKKLP
ncbi:MAG: hypothetical protein M1812_001115 [Candelaria pacifica]|nr:MAG: hypothetical protein M1812_001115 [Candelaria pacifica]